ncbi:MAG: rod shape-determining protein RodA [Acidobacteria bacterium]|nr:rod shape-determining protein RodA [Acidobacteriota bacterium]
MAGILLKETIRWRDFDGLLLLAALSLITLGTVEIYSSTPSTGIIYKDFWFKQLIALGVGLFAFVTIILTDYRKIYNFIPYIYVGSLLLLVAVLIFGHEVKGQKNWINFGPMSLQPSELAKIAVILTLSKYLSPLRKGNLPWKDVAIACLITAVPMGLIMLQPDTGSALTFIPVLALLLFMSGFNLKLIIIAAVTAIIVTPVTYFQVLKPHILKPYQIMRIEAVINPDLFEQPEFRREYGYQTLQSVIAVGSGGLTGTGVTKGTQSRLGFLPEHHTDFIASVLAEEMGFVGSISVLLLYLFIITRSIGIAERARDRFGMLVILGFAGLVFFHVIINIGMVIGLLPIIGITLPLMSYGGSSVLSMMILIGLVININLRRFAN